VLTFFVSRTSADRPEAEWIAWVREHAGHSVIVQAWQMMPSSSFVVEKHASQPRARCVGCRGFGHPRADEIPNLGKA
jgi:hypothetical protein